MRTHRVIEASDVVPVDERMAEEGLHEDMDNEEPTRKRRRTTYPDLRQEHGPEFRVYCPCLKCDQSSKPTLRLLRICNEHIAFHGVGVKWKVIF